MYQYQKKLIEFLIPFVYERRIERIEEVLNNRTRYATVVLEDIYQSQNASAVLRSCDCFGIQNVHIIENEHEYSYNTDVSMGSEKWLHLKKYSGKTDNTPDAVSSLRSQGYRIVATSPHKNDVLLPDFDVSKGKFALFFGSEKPGLSDYLLNNSDEYLKIPMYGFTESYNISVSAALILNNLITRLHDSGNDWKLTEEEKWELKLEWILKSVRKPDLLVKEFKKLNPQFNAK